MSNRISIILLGSLLLLTAAWLFWLRHEQSEPKASSLLSTCQSNNTSSYIKKLSDDTPEGAQAVMKLIDEAKESRECRDAIVNELMRVLNDADLQNDRSAFVLWARGSGILGELKAVEALDLLIDHLDLNDGLFSASMVHQPVVPAVENMGEVAVPKLGFALKHHPNKQIRLAAALCLADIDGPEALHELNSALALETDQCVRRFITIALPTTPDASKSKECPVAPNVFLQRLMAFRCNCTATQN